MSDGAMSNKKLSIFVSAGEASGDLHGSNLVRALQARLPQLRVACLGGAMLRQAGAEVLVDNRETAVVGLSEVFRHVQSIVRAWRIITAHLVRERPALLVIIDFPDFNLLLARWAKRHGIRIFYYICPQLWAWRSGRTRTLKRLIDRMVVVLPFEPAFYASHNLTAYYVGHPLLDVLAAAPTREQARSRYAGADPSALVGLLPGSRSSELRMLLPLLLETAHRLHTQRPDLTFLLPVAPSLSATLVEQAVASTATAHKGRDRRYLRGHAGLRCALHCFRNGHARGGHTWNAHDHCVQGLEIIRHCRPPFDSCQARGTSQSHRAAFHRA